MRFTQNTFYEDYMPTLDDKMHKDVTLLGQSYHLEIADTAGQESGSPGSSSSMLNVDGWVLVFSMASRKSLEQLRVTRNNLVESTGYKNLPMVLVGNKVDLTDECQVSAEEVTKLAGDWGCPVVFASAKCNQNVDAVFERCLLQVEKSMGNLKDEKKCNLS
ncbi:hypothetical protein BOX15_Mlig027148g1 [Macrostomum lignano]|uniref:Small monomeric GTPase n=3 Tax=Macrostomum lignano TaxID=282301 RepID=A0A1I8GSQ8_9PLAT|nr:hypothetical protein BOX15_Mlig027148g1 [Macrostomum lignano]